MKPAVAVPTSSERQVNTISNNHGQGQDDAMVQHTFTVQTKAEITSGPKRATMTTRPQHAAGLRKLEEILSTSRPEHPGTTVSNYPEEAYTSLCLRRLKNNWLLKINWDECSSPKNPRYKQQKPLVVESTPNKDTLDLTAKMKMKQYQKDAFLFKASFGGRIVLDEIAPQFGYTFIVPGFVTFCMLTNFKCKATIDLHRRRMAKLSTAKSVFYCQLHWVEGFKDTSVVMRTWRENTLIDNCSYYTLEGYLKNISEAINTATGNKSKYEESLCSLIETEKAVHQPGHIADETCAGVAGEYQPWILHQPLCADGRSLQIWTEGENGKLAPQFLHIPFGSACVLRGDIFHGGCYGSKGNIGYHAQLNFRPAEGKYLGILKENMIEQSHETAIPADEVNSTAQTKDQVKFTHKYLRNMKKVCPSDTFWVQQPEENANWPVTRMNLKTT
jgi:hypothetical protein